MVALLVVSMERLWVDYWVAMTELHLAAQWVFSTALKMADVRVVHLDRRWAALLDAKKVGRWAPERARRWAVLMDHWRANSMAGSMDNQQAASTASLTVEWWECRWVERTAHYWADRWGVN